MQYLKVSYLMMHDLVLITLNWLFKNLGRHTNLWTGSAGRAFGIGSWQNLVLMLQHRHWLMP